MNIEEQNKIMKAGYAAVLKQMFEYLTSKTKELRCCDSLEADVKYIKQGLDKILERKKAFDAIK
jgi:predicted metal-binding protein